MARLIYHVKQYNANGSIEEIKIWQLPRTKDKPYGLKYSFVYIVNGERVVGYDNYEGKESQYTFKNLKKLWNDFKKDIQRCREGAI
ncbi:MAG: DUF6516 family protein [Proteobacteria bacterium]|nr:DUF6516 family protein [Pseudomonadota bacterium]